MQTLYLVRHAQAGFGEDNYDALSELGYQQAHRLGQFLTRNGIGFTRQQVICGTLQRHQQTLDALWLGLQQQNRPPDQSVAPMEDIYQDSNWNEYDHQNVLGGLNPDFATPAGLQDYLSGQADPRAAFAETFSKAIDRWVNSKGDSHYVESWAGFRSRVQQGLKQACAREQRKLLVITSGGPISLLAQQLLGAQEQHFLHLNWGLANCSISRVLNGRNGVRLSTLNDYTAFDATPEFITYK